MMSRYLPTALAVLAVLPACLSAQETSAAEEERLNALVRDDLQWREPRNHVTVGLRVLSKGGRVDFGNLGERIATPISPVADGVVDRAYDNGAVNADGLRANEKDANGNQISPPGGRYEVLGKDSSGNDIVVGDFVSYTPGQSRNWFARNEGQYQPHAGYVGFSTYSAISEGASLSKEQGATGGVELEFSRDLGRLGRRVQWGVNAGITLNGINSKVAGTVTSTLRTYTDYYLIPGTQKPILPYSAPFTIPLLNSDGISVNDNGLEITIPISALPDATKTTLTDLAGGASINGRWQVKGAYFMVKLGPTLRTRLSDSFTLTASAGFAGAYAGTRYSVFESFTVGTGATAIELTVDEPEGSTETQFMTGYYADLSLDWAANDRTGLFGGVTTQQLGNYSQTLGGRTARIDLGATVGLRGGVSIKF